MSRQTTTPTAPGNPVSNLLRFSKEPVHMLTELAAEVGDVFRLWLGPFRVTVVVAPEAVDYVLHTSATNYVRGPFYRGFNKVMGAGLLSTDGEQWRRHRRAAQPALVRRSSNGADERVGGLAEEMVDRWEHDADGDGVVDIRRHSSWLTMQVISNVLFGTDISFMGDRIAKAVDVSVRVLLPSSDPSIWLPSWVPTRRSREIAYVRATVVDIARQLIARRQPEEAHQDLVAHLRQSRTGGGQPWPEQEVVDEVVTVFLAGYETTALAVTWLMYALASNPAVQERAAEEVAGVVGDADFDSAHVDRLTYCEQILDETLRVYPPIWVFPPQALLDDDVLGHHIPAGSSVFLSPYATQHCARHWEDPERFDPDRFHPDRRDSIPRSAMFPFGIGPRACIGRHLARLELLAAMVAVLRRYRLVLPESTRPRLGEPVASLRPMGDVAIALERRPAPAPVAVGSP
jgi:cytochrome P450